MLCLWFCLCRSLQPTTFESGDKSTCSSWMFTVNNVTFWNVTLQAVHRFIIIFSSVCSRVLLGCSSLLGLREVEDISSYLSSKLHRRGRVKPKSCVSKQSTPLTLVNLEPEYLIIYYFFLSKGNLFRHLTPKGKVSRELGTTFWGFFVFLIISMKKGACI